MSEKSTSMTRRLLRTLGFGRRHAAAAPKDALPSSEGGDPPSASGEPRVSSDRPTASLKEDRYGLKANFIPRLARIALEWPSRDGLVVGLFGSWGIGKTSVLNMFRDYVNQNRTQYPSVLFASFNPWFYEDTGALVTSFFATIAAELGKDDKKPWARAARALKAMGAFLTIASKGVTVFGVNLDAEKLGEAAKLGAEALKDTSEISGGLAGLAELMDEGEKKLDQYRDEVEKALKSLGHSNGRIIILIDDVDRLNKTELLSLLRLIRMVADLPYVTFVVAMDDERVRDVLGTAVTEGYGQGYLDKIVQVPLHVPLPGRDAITNELVSQITATFGMRGLSLPQELSPLAFGLRPPALNLLVSLIHTPRDLARYINGLRTLVLAGADPDVNPTDAALIEALHIFYPDVYDRVRRHKDFLTASSDQLFHQFDLDKDHERVRAARSAELDLIVKGGATSQGPKTEKSIRELLKALFGDVTSRQTRDDSSGDAAERKIRSPMVFDNYFRYEPIYGAITRREVDALFEQLALHARTEFIDGISRTLVAAFVGRAESAVDQMVRDLGYKLTSASPEFLGHIGKGILTAHGQLEPTIGLELLTKVLHALSQRLLFSTDSEAAVQSYKRLPSTLLHSVIHSQMPVSQIYALLERRLALNWVSEEELHELTGHYIQRVDKELQEGDPFGQQDNEEMAQAYNFALKQSKSLGEASSVAPEALRAHLIEYIKRRPKRLPQVLYSISVIPSGGSPLLLSPRRSQESVLADLHDLFGHFGQLQSTYEVLMTERFDAGRYNQLMEDFGKLLGSLPSTSPTKSNESGESGDS